MLHENDPLLGGCEFGIFFDGRTPQDLLHDGIYKALALALYPGPFQPVSVALAATVLGAVPEGSAWARLSQWICGSRPNDSGDAQDAGGVVRWGTTKRHYSVGALRWQYSRNLRGAGSTRSETSDGEGKARRSSRFSFMSRSSPNVSLPPKDAGDQAPAAAVSGAPVFDAASHERADAELDHEAMRARGVALRAEVQPPPGGAVVTPWGGGDAAAAAEGSGAAPLRFAAFLTHDWGEDELGRDNHARVLKVYEALAREGLEAWFDEKQMVGDVPQQMAKGVDSSSCAVVFITERYLTKVEGLGPAGDDDNCKLEFGYAALRLGVARIVPVVMEPSLLTTSKWHGAVGAKLGDRMYVDLTSDAPEAWDSGVSQLLGQIGRINQKQQGGAAGRRALERARKAVAPSSGEQELSSVEEQRAWLAVEALKLEQQEQHY